MSSLTLLPIAHPKPAPMLGDLGAFVPVRGNERWWQAFIMGADQVTPGAHRWRDQAREVERRLTP